VFFVATTTLKHVVYVGRCPLMPGHRNHYQRAYHLMSVIITSDINVQFLEFFFRQIQWTETCCNITFVL
jgi:hypothetical protein